MVTTRNRSKAGGAETPASNIVIELPVKARRSRSTTTKKTTTAKTSRSKTSSDSGNDASEQHYEEPDSETVESSSPTSTPDSSSPKEPRDDDEDNDNDNDNNSHHSSSSHDESVEKTREEALQATESQDNDNRTLTRKTTSAALKEEEDDDDASDNGESGDSDDQDEEDASGQEQEDDDDEEDLDELLLKAQQSLKRKAMFEREERSEKEPRFSFPKLQSGLDPKDVYLTQNGNRVKVDPNTVVVVDKAGSADNKSALETCKVNLNAHEVHVSKKQKKEEKEKTAGKGWFDLPQQVLTPELKRDLQILKLRNVLDPKRFYKREDKSKPKFPKYFQVGTIVEGNTEFYSSRLTKKERATTITGEVMKDLTGRDYYKRKFDEIQESKQSGGKKFYKKGKGKQSKGWRAHK
ncbi:hypothetical protein BGZ99_009981 [Dissophora globulifera]|uniref:Fcf2 pre-rRNA processing C-terminal domain-containing protein n=1 Tax=Dissophora globulifera TaxID=979702 RepID=A0A9P6R4G0_9FUNG|nr:hypothetical protein BGZ99_009981 [Dissophora globulifera]